ncbi:MAG: hypothetical protein HFE80_11935 [Clostridiaceae bacterium]|nr:hypothetical protein [Clostridiaceae bacterium]
MNNFQQITRSPEALGAFLRSLSCVEGPWDKEFQARFCAGCDAENCDACTNSAARNSPAWWLGLDGGALEQAAPQVAATPDGSPVVLWVDGVNSSIVLEHYGHVKDLMVHTGFWRNDGTIFQKLAQVPELIEQYGKGKIRAIFDYDPDYPRALIQIWGLPTPDLQSAFPEGTAARENR